MIASLMKALNFDSGSDSVRTPLIGGRAAGGMHGLGKIRLHKPLLEHPEGVEVLAPHDLVNARFGEDVSSLIVGGACYKSKHLVVVAFVEPCDINPLCAGHVSHVGIVTSNDDPACSFIVFKDTDGLWDRSVAFYFALTDNGIGRTAADGGVPEGGEHHGFL